MICLIQPSVFKDRLWADDSQVYSPVSDLPMKIQPDWCIQLPRRRVHLIPTETLRLNASQRERLMPPRLFSPNLFSSFFLISVKTTHPLGCWGWEARQASSSKPHPMSSPSAGSCQLYPEVCPGADHFSPPPLPAPGPAIAIFSPAGL